MKSETKAKISRYGWPTAYFVLGIALAVSVCTAAFKTSFVRIYVSGQSMVPTLDGGQHSGGALPGDTVDFGYMDPSSQAIDNLKRFNIVTTYFPYTWNSADYDAEGKLKTDASYKIKRVIAFPNETIKISVSDTGVCNYRIKSGNNVLDFSYSDSKKGWVSTVDGNEKVYSYEIRHGSISSLTAEKNYETTLGPDEYFVMGDNWDVSSDSSTNYYHHHVHIKKNNLQGVLIAIEGKATVYYNESTKKNDLKDLVYGEIKYFYQEL